MFECHITMLKDCPRVMRRFEEIAKILQWKTSSIEGDPFLGKDTFFYFTCYHTSLPEIQKKMDKLCIFLKDRGYKVIRKKIELVIYDTKEKPPI